MKNPEPGPRIAAIFDLDGTLTQKDTYLAFLLGFLRRHPRRLTRVIGLPFALVLYWLKLKDNSWLKKTFLRAIMGNTTRVELACWRHVFLDRLLKSGLRPGVVEALQQHRRDGHHLVLLTASFDFYAEELGRRLGFDEVICTRSVWEQDKLKGELGSPNCYADAKLARLNDYFRGQREQWHIVGYSDHHSDAPFMAWVDHPIAVHPTKKLREIAERQGYDIFTVAKV